MAARTKASNLACHESGAYRFESCVLPVGVERLGSFRHPSPVVGSVLHSLGISLPYGGLCGMHRLPPLGYIPNELIRKKKWKIFGTNFEGDRLLHSGGKNLSLLFRQ